MHIYETKRMSFFVFKKEYIKQMNEIWGNQEVMARSGGAVASVKIPKIVKWYEDCHKEYGLSVYSLKDKKSNEIIGAAGFNIDASVKRIELIAHFRKSYWHKGYATEAITGCIKLAKRHKKVKYIQASCDPKNEASIRIVEKLGFTLLGKEWFEDTRQEELVYELRLF